MAACYASQLKDCGRKRSREHYISESLLHHLNQNSDLRVEGLPWTQGKSKRISPNALTAKILCERHNAALSPLDGMAVHFFKAFDEEGAQGSGRQLLHLFNGHDIERWLLKVLCGITYSKNLLFDSDTDTTIPEYWLEILFGREQLPKHQGLYICKSSGHRFEGPQGLKFRAITGRGRLTGIGAVVCGYEMILSMSGFPTRLFDGREMVYRPFELYTVGQKYEKSIVFNWEGSADLGTISLRIGE